MTNLGHGPAIRSRVSPTDTSQRGAAAGELPDTPRARGNLALGALALAAYALGIAVGAPLITALTTRFERRALARVALAVFVAGNLVVVFSGSLGLLLAARVLTGSIHGLFIGVATVIAAGVVSPEHRGRAISLVFGGIMVATAVGAPLGNVIGQIVGWRGAFVAVSILGLVALAATSVLPLVPHDGAAGMREQLRAALAPRVLAMLGVGLVLMGGQFAAFTYLVPFLQTVTGVSPRLVSLLLLDFGVAAAVGTYLGGRAADRNPTATIVVAIAGVVVALAALYQFGSSPVAVVPLLAVWGLAGFAMVAPYQVRVISLAGSGGDLAATLGASAVNAGIAGGALLGGWALTALGAHSVMIVAAVVCAVALPGGWATRRLDPPPAASRCA